MIENPPSDAEGTAASLAATFQHIELLHAKQAKLLAAREEAEAQLLHRLGAAHRSNQVSISQLIEHFNRYKALDLAGRSKRWNENIGINWHIMARMAEGPNGPEGTWVGDWPCSYYAPMPGRGVSVVYVLFDDRNVPCYVGSSRALRNRLRDHEKDGKWFVHWQAYPCADREHAYQLEDRLLKQHMPHLNRRAGR